HPRPCRPHLSLSTTRPPPTSTRFPYTTLFRSRNDRHPPDERARRLPESGARPHRWPSVERQRSPQHRHRPSDRNEQERRGEIDRSEEHTSELQSRENLVCRLLLEKKKNNNLRR